MNIFFFNQKTAYEMRIIDWSSDVCSSDLPHVMNAPACRHAPAGAGLCDLYRQFAVVDRGDDEPVARRIFERDIDLFAVHLDMLGTDQIGRASSRERVCPYV